MREREEREGVEKAQAVAMYQAVAVYEEDKAGVQAVERVRREIVLRPGGEKKGGEKKGGGVEASKPRGVLLAEIESSGVEKAGAVKEEKVLRGGIRLREPGERRCGQRREQRECGEAVGLWGGSVPDRDGRAEEGEERS